MKFFIVRSMFLLLALAAGSSMAATHYVVPPGTAGVNPADPYTNWATAGTNIIAVVNAALTNTAPRMVWVTNGTYYTTNIIDLKDKGMTIQGVNGRDYTILTPDASYAGRCMQMTYCDVDPAVFSTYVAGLTFSNYQDSVYGAGIFVNQRRNVVVTNCLFANNRVTGYYGGGICIYGGSGGNDRLYVYDSVFRNNYAKNKGGAIMANYGYHALEKLYIAGCCFEGNVSTNGDPSGGGAVYALNVADLIVSNCVFSNSYCIYSGGGLWVDAVSNTFINATGLIANCTFVDNSVGISQATALGTGGGLSIYTKGQNNGITVRDCLFARNRAAKYNNLGQGGGVYVNVDFAGSPVVLENCTIVSNSANWKGGGLVFDGTSGNVGTGINDIVYFNAATINSNYFSTNGNMGLSYSCVAPAVDGVSNITLDPRLVNLSGGNYRQLPASPVINKGSIRSWMTGAKDLDGNPRVLEEYVDMGAFEVHGLPRGSIIAVR